MNKSAILNHQLSLTFHTRTKYVFPNRGKGDYFRLGHGTDVHVRKPQMVEGLRGKKIVHVAVGALHCLAVTDTGQVCTDVHHIKNHSTPFSLSQLLLWHRSRCANLLTFTLLVLTPMTFAVIQFILSCIIPSLRTNLIM